MLFYCVHGYTDMTCSRHPHRIWKKHTMSVDKSATWARNLLTSASNDSERINVSCTLVVNAKSNRDKRMYAPIILVHGLMILASGELYSPPERLWWHSLWLGGEWQRHSGALGRKNFFRRAVSWNCSCRVSFTTVIFIFSNGKRFLTLMMRIVLYDKDQWWKVKDYEKCQFRWSYLFFSDLLPEILSKNTFESLTSNDCWLMVHVCY